MYCFQHTRSPCRPLRHQTSAEHNNNSRASSRSRRDRSQPRSQHAGAAAAAAAAGGGRSLSSHSSPVRTAARASADQQTTPRRYDDDEEDDDEDLPASGVTNAAEKYQTERRRPRDRGGENGSGDNKAPRQTRGRASCPSSPRRSSKRRAPSGKRNK